jgi:hypothetical protein
VTSLQRTEDRRATLNLVALLAVLCVLGCSLSVFEGDLRTWGKVPDDARPWDAESCEGIAADLALLQTVKAWGARRTLVFDSLSEVSKTDDEKEWVGELVRAWDTDLAPVAFYRRCMTRLLQQRERF